MARIKTKRKRLRECEVKMEFDCLIKKHFRTKCCYGLTMDLLDNIATELGFEFHLYVVRDQLFGSRQQRDVKDFLKSKSAQHSSNNVGTGTTTTTTSSSSSSGTSNKPKTSTSYHDVDDETSNSK